MGEFVLCTVVSRTQYYSRLGLLIPGGSFEVALAIWLLVTGFNPAAYDRTRVTHADA